MSDPAVDAPPTPAPVAPTAPVAAGEGEVAAEVVPEAQTSTTTPDPAATVAGSQIPVLEGSGTAQPGVEAPAAATGGTSPMPEVTAPVLEGTGAVAGPANGSEAAAAKAAAAEPTTPAAEETPNANAAATPATPATPAKPEKADVSQRHAGDHGQGHGGDAATGEHGNGQPAAATTPAATQSQATHANAAASPPPVSAHTAAQPQTAQGAPLLPAQVHRMQALVDFALKRGHAQAHLELHPAELGQVNVRLRSSSGGGLTATMTVDRPEALQALQAAADQLRRSLEDQGVQVTRLDIGLSAQARGDEARTGAQTDGRDASDGISRRGGTDAANGPDNDDPDFAPAAARPLNPGALVDVRA